MENKLYKIDNILWIVDKYNDYAIPVCPKDKIRLITNNNNSLFNNEETKNLNCEECGKKFYIKRTLREEKEYIIEKVRAFDRKDYSIIDIDGIQTPVTRKKKINLNNGYFCVAQVRESKRGPQVVIYAGKKNKQNRKSQIFISESERRLSFDHNNIHPTDIFTRITAEFDDGSKQIIEKQPDGSDC